LKQTVRTFDQSGKFEIRVAGKLNPSWSDWLADGNDDILATRGIYLGVDNSAKWLAA
jgi:hypothetical protein